MPGPNQSIIAARVSINIKERVWGPPRGLLLPRENLLRIAEEPLKQRLQCRTLSSEALTSNASIYGTTAPLLLS